VAARVTELRAAQVARNPLRIARSPRPSLLQGGGLGRQVQSIKGRRRPDRASKRDSGRAPKGALGPARWLVTTRLGGTWHDIVLPRVPVHELDTLCAVRPYREWLLLSEHELAVPPCSDPELATAKGVNDNQPR